MGGGVLHNALRIFALTREVPQRGPSSTSRDTQRAKFEVGSDRGRTKAYQFDDPIPP